MVSTIAIHQHELTIIRQSVEHHGQTVVLDNEGEFFEAFPQEMTNEQIRFCIGLINRHYDRGVRLGEVRKANQIKAALGISE